MSRLATLLFALALLAPEAFAQSVVPLWEHQFNRARSIAVSPDGTEVVVGEGSYQAATLIFLDSQSGDSIATIQTEAYPSPRNFRSPEVMVYEPNGETVIAGHHNIYGSGGGGGGEQGGSGTGANIDVRRWNPDAPTPEASQVYAFDGASSALAVNETVLVHAERFEGSSTPNLFVRDLDTAELIYSENSEDAPIYAAFSPDGNTLATIHLLSDTPIQIRRAGVWSTEITVDIDVFLLQPVKIAFSPDGTRAVVSTRAYTGVGVYVFDTSDWSLERYIEMPENPEGSAAEVIGEFSQDGRYVVTLRRERGSGLSEWTARISAYSVETGELVLTDLLVPYEVYPQVPPADIERIPGTDEYLWHANNRAGVVSLDMGAQVVADEAMPGTEALSLSAHPNPASTSITANYTLAASGDVRLTAHDLLGREVAVLASGAKASGTHRATLDVSSLPSGVYVLRLATPEATEVQRVTVVR